MKSHILSGRWVVPFLLVATALCIIPASRVQAGSDKPIPGPAFLILSLEDKFDIPTDMTAKNAKGSATVIVEIGDFIAGQDIYNTRFKANPSVKVKLPNKVKSFANLNGHALTIIGGFDAPDASVHLVTPTDDDDIPRKVQEAFFVASPELTDEFVNTFPTTVEIAQFIYDTAIASDAPPPPPPAGYEDPQDPPTTLGAWLDYDHAAEFGSGDPRGGKLTAQQILDNIFTTNVTLDAPEEDVFAEAEGDLLPHQPGQGDPLFGFELSIDPDDGTTTTAMEIDVEVDIKPGNTDNVINNSENGVVWVAVLSTSAFSAATEIDLDHYGDVVLGPNEAAAKDYKIEDANHDDIDDVTFKFDTEEIGLTTSTTSLTITGPTTTSGTSFTGSDSVTVK